MEKSISKIQRIPGGLSDMWEHEEYDFTPWLGDNIDVINDTIGLDITILEREQTAGDFRIDLVAEDDSGNTIIIENQLKKSDHDHLGKLITYLSVIGAKAAIWIVPDPRPGHIRAVQWLNESSGADFYLLKLEAIRIEDSDPAPLLTLIVGPSNEVREVGQTRWIAGFGVGAHRNRALAIYCLDTKYLRNGGQHCWTVRGKKQTYMPISPLLNLTGSEILKCGKTRLEFQLQRNSARGYRRPDQKRTG